MWTIYQVRWEFVTKLCASVPADPAIVEAWIDNRTPKVKPAGGKSIAEIKEEVFDTLAQPPAEEQFSMLVFQQQPSGLVVRASTIKAHIKDCARVLSNQYVDKIKGERAFSTRVINGVYPDERTYWVPILRPDGTQVQKADGCFDKAIHVRGPQGQPMNALKRFEWIDHACITFRLKVLGKSVKEEDLRILFEYGGVHGYAGERGDGEGKYLCTLTKEEA